MTLIPLMGIEYIIFNFVPNEDYLAHIRYKFDLFFISFQGLFVSVLFCFINQEVKREIRRSYQRRQVSSEKFEISNLLGNAVDSSRIHVGFNSKCNLWNILSGSSKTLGRCLYSKFSERTNRKLFKSDWLRTSTEDRSLRSLTTTTTIDWGVSIAGQILSWALQFSATFWPGAPLTDKKLRNCHITSLVYKERSFLIRFDRYKLWARQLVLILLACFRIPIRLTFLIKTISSASNRIQLT